VSRPTIGITSYWTQAAMSHWSCDAVLVSQGYVEGVRVAGGRPVVLPADTTWIEEPDDVLDIVDALLVVGGNDIAPTHYGQEPHVSIGALSPRRDAVELALVRRAVARDVPLLGICRGVQVLNVAEGGTLIQDIPSAVTSDLRHSINQPKNQIAHDIVIAPATRLASSLEPTLAQVPGVKPRPTIVTCPVNSRHHQAVNAVAPSFVVSARSTDGIVEAIERPASTFCVGVQWHPENFWRTGEFKGLFSAFVSAAASQGRATRRRF
jgi:putative glutamine amidotransferase